MKYAYLLVALLCALLFSNCKKDSSSGYNLAFYTLDSASSYQLVFDSTNKGKLPYIKDGANDCGDSRALRITSLQAGSHVILAVDSLGITHASGTVTLANNEISTSGTKGMIGSISIGTCGVIDLEK